jgi:hypothetical protein
MRQPLPTRKGRPGTSGNDPIAPAGRLVARTIDELVIDDEDSFRHVGLYADLKEVLRRAKYKFRVLPAAVAGRWDQALLLNLTYWQANAGGDVLADDHIAPDVVTHAAWHHLAAAALGAPSSSQSADALFLGEAIASAFDVYLVGRLLGHSPDASFLDTQVAAMAASAETAGLSEKDFSWLLESVSDDPDRAFEDLRELLCDATSALLASGDAEEALAALEALGGHRFAPLLHHYELSNWVLYARAYAAASREPDARARSVDRELRTSKVALDWLTDTWVLPKLT